MARNYGLHPTAKTLLDGLHAVEEVFVARGVL